jgi:hypothetical protein
MNDKEECMEKIFKIKGQQTFSERTKESLCVKTKLKLLNMYL